ncbi:putative hydrolase of the HAD superfamily [Chitinophaga niastensis]|uniref:Putative hydrolase of the HAD superfamily n=1 Tax=Chitinophaga niastensis TaxID=536980 RepID=A0A2P8HRV1_CHINA|nr:HAD family hydrolase [Chitinophaga niastensis]PSL48951.1 putative hydrolase of the HAD superfamily [Chitinophaga niastensis]
MSKKQIKVVAFDLDNTLYNEHLYYEGVLDEFCKKNNLDQQKLIRDYRSISRSNPDIFGELLRINNMYTAQLQEELFSIYNNINITITPYNTALTVLEYLKKKDIRTAIVTNGHVSVQENKIRCLGIADLFDLIVYARTWGKAFEKPAPKAYEFLLSNFICSPAEVLFVGDKVETDIRGARDIGMPSLRVYEESDLITIINQI